MLAVFKTCQGLVTRVCGTICGCVSRVSMSEQVNFPMSKPTVFILGAVQ